MARAFEDHVIPNAGTNIYSTTVAANRAWDADEVSAYPASIRYDAAGSISTTGASAKSTKNQKGLRLTKIKSSPSHGALAAARSVSRGKGHRRGRSASEATSPITPTFTSHQIDSSIEPLHGLIAQPTIPANPYQMAPPASHSRTKVKIKPLLRKLSSHDEQNTVDLSKSAAENAIGDTRKASSDVAYTGIGYHNRTTSEASHISSMTSSSHHRYGAQYVHPMRQRPYTPPPAGSFANSLQSGSFGVVPNDFIHPDPPTQHDTNRAPLPSPRRIRPPLHVRTGSSPRLASSSQTNLPGTPSSLRKQTDTSDPPLAMASTRTSLDSVFRKRSRANTIEDPVVRAAQVAILRKEFDERERVKDEQRREQEARKAQKEAKKQQKRDESQQRKSESRARKRAQSNATSEKSAHPFQSQQGTLSRQTTGGGGTGQRPQTRGSTKTASGAGKAVTNKWQLFVFWLKTLILRMKKRMSGSSG
ncbi:MAG: hypothetical protein LQ338_006511 [Usnochroma carphineum]|nr:MAG: hypothetical protein LQ338_006511 [Usnochroma carphineum]